MLLGMINTLLDVEKMESGEMQLEYAALSADELVATAVSQVASLAESNGLTLVPQIAPNLPLFQGDADKLRRTLVNLLGNAIKFTPRGGTVTVEAAAGSRRTRAAVFRPRYRRRHPARSVRAYLREVRAGGNSQGRAQRRVPGLGLTFCKLAVEAHGGSIQVDSVPGKGSVFSFTIPLTTNTLLPDTRNRELTTV